MTGVWVSSAADIRELVGFGVAIARVAPPLTAAAFVLLWREPIAYSVPAASRALDHRSESHYAAAMIADAQLLALSEAVGEKLRESGLRIVTAESCTGGWIGKVLTDVSGSSSWYLGGAVVYSNQLKESLLNVRAATLADHGAVSESTAREMAAGALERLGGDHVGRDAALLEFDAVVETPR